MGFLDRAKDTIKKATKGIGEETVNVVDYDEIHENKEREKRQRFAKKKPVRNSKPASSSNWVEPDNELNPDYDNTAHENIPVVEDTAFDIDLSETKDFITEKQESSVNSNERHPDKKASDEKVKDVLELLNIPITFEIESDVFLPDDLKNVSFDIQVPQGYEIGEVNTFVSRTKISINRLVELLKQRNEHIAKLATMVDRLQVDVNNMKFQNEVANGINVMPTSSSDNEDLENENIELRLAVKRLQEELDSTEEQGTYVQSDELSNSQKEQFRNLQDELSLSHREIEDLKEEIYELKNQNAVLLDSQDFIDQTQAQEELAQFSFDDNEDSESLYNDSDDEEVEDTLEFPDADVTNLSSFGEDSHIPDPSQNSAFYDEDIESTESFLKENAEFYEVDPSENPEDNAGIFDDYEDEDYSNSKSTSKVSYFEDEDDDDVLSNLQNWENK